MSAATHDRESPVFARYLGALLNSARESLSDWRLNPARTVKRYGLAIGFVAAATLVMQGVEKLTGKPQAFPFYAAVVVSGWIGTGPGVVAVILSTLAVEFFWAEPRFSLDVGSDDLPWFISFVLCTLMAFAWSWQRRRAEQALETAVQQRTADLQVEIAERIATQEELRRSEAELARALRLATLAEVATGIAHEINQPLAAITANGGACLRSLDREPPLLDTARDAARCIVVDGHRAGDVIARIRALFNREMPQWRLLDLNDIVERVAELMRSEIDKQQVVVRLKLAKSPVWVCGDVVQLQQVLVNLVTNALEAMRGIDGRRRLLTIRSEINGPSDAVITVEDRGRGLNPEQISRMFESFYTTKPDGIGVGLAISRTIIEAHGGSLRATVAPRHGARVGFDLPLAAAMGNAPSRPNRAMLKS